MKLFHGTASYNLGSFKTSAPRKKQQPHLKKPAFCTSLEFKESERFAFRKTPANDLTLTGIVLEFDGSLLGPKDYVHAVDPCAIHDEREIAIFETGKLRLVAYWKFEDDWKRIKI